MPKKLFLASELSQTIQEFISTLNLKPTANRVAFIDEAAKPNGNPEDLPWIKDDKQKFLDFGFELEKIDIFNFKNESEIERKLNDFDIIHFCGGNTLYLNYSLHKTGFYSVVKNLVETEKLIYTGTSAGSMVAAPDLFEIKEGLLEDIDPVFLDGITRQDYFGLVLAPFLIMPHINNSEFKSDFYKTIDSLPDYPHPLIFLRDNQAVLVEGDSFSIIQKD